MRRHPNVSLPLHTVAILGAGWKQSQLEPHTSFHSQDGSIASNAGAAAVAAHMARVSALSVRDSGASHLMHTLGSQAM